MLNKQWTIFIQGLMVIMVCFHFYTSGFGMYSDLIQRVIHLAFVLPLTFLLRPASKKLPKDKLPVYDVALAALSVVCCLYILANYNTVLYKSLQWSGSIDKIFAVCLTLLVLESSRRVIGMVFPVLAVLLFLYAYFGPWLPGYWAHKQFSIDYIFQVLYHSTNGVWGSMVGISSTMLAMFAIFGGVLASTGGAGTFIKLGQLMTGNSIGGPGKVTIISTGLFGMVSGSPQANVMTIGTFTIPLMKNSGYTSDWAAAITSMGACGGQIMPPIMGTAAFVMAQLLSVNYMEVAVAAFIPAVLYYYGAFVAVHYISKRYNIRGNTDDIKVSLKDLFIIGLPIVIFMMYLSFGYTVTYGAFWATNVSVLVCSFTYFVAEKKTGPAMRQTVKLVYNSAIDGSKSLLNIATLLAGSQITISLIQMSGLGIKLSDLIVSMGRDQLFLCLLLSMVVCLILGMGLPTTASYVLGVAILVPALITLGLTPFVAHMFVIYFASLAHLTPPVCATVFLASGIAQSRWVRTGYLSCMIALPGFVVPFTFAYNPAMLVIGTWSNILISTVTALVGVFFIGIATAGYLRKPIALFFRALFVAGGIMLLMPDILTSAVGLTICVATYLWFQSRPVTA